LKKREERSSSPVAAKEEQVEIKSKSTLKREQVALKDLHEQHLPKRVKEDPLNLKGHLCGKLGVVVKI